MTIHTVKRGDTIYSVAREYGVPPSRIITDNLLNDPANLVVGEDLVIRYPTVTHTVMGGETLYSVAQRYGVSLNRLYRNNPSLGGMPSVFPGQILNVSYEEPPLGEITTNGYVYPYVDRSTLRRTLPYLTYLSIFTYGINGDGSLIEPTGGDEELIAIAREYGTVPLMMLTTLNSEGKFSSALAAELLSNADARQTVAENAARTMREKGYGGIDVDFEYVSGEAANGYVDFITRIKAEVGEDYPVFVSLAPKYRADQPGLLYEGHDYPALGAAADYVLLMTYEWGYAFGPPLAVSPLSEVRRVVGYGLSEIPGEKIQLGVPNYGYDWALPYVRGESRARSLSNVEAVELARRVHAEIQFDERAASPFFTYYDRPNTFSDAVRHVVWFENARSVEAMLRLVREFSLNGASVWNVMRYFPALWLVLNALYDIRRLG
ncbi:MAG: glycosyl hydrolase family 18 protein [Clostridia bacterium]|nr:glycosyl hydrolase family 18 protein [Clostridia bacterium]